MRAHQYYHLYFFIVFFLSALILWQPENVYADSTNITCAKLQGDMYHNGRNDKLQKQAKLSEWNRYHGYVIDGLCHGNLEDLDWVIDKGYVSISDVNAIAKLLGKKYEPKPRTKDGLLYEKIYKELSRTDLCMACASNIAEAYVKQPDSQLAIKVDKALQGNQTALSELKELNSAVPLPEQNDQTSIEYLYFGFTLMIRAILVFLAVLIIAAIARFFIKSSNHTLNMQDTEVKEHTPSIKPYKIIIMAFAVITIILLIFGDGRSPKEIACAYDWHHCPNNQQLIDNGFHHMRMVSACKLSANKRAKYGTPTFPSNSFSEYQPGEEYVKTGVVYLFERDALFQNAFGTEVHTKVLCQYNLNHEAVDYIIIRD